MGGTEISKRKRYLILVLLFLGWLLGNIDRLIINVAVLSIGEDLQLNASETGLVISSFFAGYALMQIPGGLLTDRYGFRKIMIIAVVTWSLFTSLTAVAWSFTSIIVIRFLFGIGEGSLGSASAKTISVFFPQSERGRAMSIVLLTGSIAGIITPILAASMITFVGWRMTFAIIGSIGIIVALLYWIHLKMPATAQQTPPSPTSSAGQRVPYAQILKMPLIWKLFVATFGIYVVNWGLISWMPTYLVKVRHLDLMSMGFASMIPAAAGILSVLLTGYIVDKLSSKRHRQLAILCTIVAAVLLFQMFHASSVAAFIVYQTITIFFTSFVTILLGAYPVKKFATHIIGSVQGVINFGAQLAGLITPMAIGFIVDAFHGSFEMAFWFMIAFDLICMLSFLILRDDKGELLESNGEVKTTILQ
ncbi:MFS transporter [Brevibacillus ruminantium]|uniref:MFS transporter n=1 Tax=Brevibacillus ruminantium TaxID=2950604 RepID=A0ABY4WK88_9BACL|nr:MFS transporter [Brevibacillus ruminantium]USG65066.1 MFS transporter [Brevibacillus ruminantium]